MPPKLGRAILRVSPGVQAEGEGQLFSFLHCANLA
jgi:hypothetical protein